MSQPSRPYQPELIKALKDPAEAVAYLNAALADSSEEIFMMALRNVAKARGIEEFSAAQPGSESSDPLSSADDIPRLSRLSTFLKMLGFRLAVEARATLST